MPLARSAEAEIVAVGARADESLGLALEERTDDTWRVLASTSGRAVHLALPISESTADLRFRLWSLDRRPATAEVTAYAGAMPHHSEADLARGFALEALPGVAPRLAVAMVDLTEPGCFRRESRDGGPPELMQALAAGATFERAAPTLAPVGFAMPLAAALAEGETAQVQARRAGHQTLGRRVNRGPDQRFGVVFGVSVRGREGKHGGAWRKRQAQVLLSCRQVEK